MKTAKVDMIYIAYREMFGEIHASYDKAEIADITGIPVSSITKEVDKKPGTFQHDYWKIWRVYVAPPKQTK